MRRLRDVGTLVPIMDVNYYIWGNLVCVSGGYYVSGPGDTVTTDITTEEFLRELERCKVNP